jgi:hypothetical protein
MGAGNASHTNRTPARHFSFEPDLGRGNEVVNTPGVNLPTLRRYTGQLAVLTGIFSIPEFGQASGRRDVVQRYIMVREAARLW